MLNMKSKIWERQWLKRLLWILLFAIIWQTITVFNWANPALLPPLSQIFGSLNQSLHSGELLQATWLSLKLILGGLLIGMLVALLLAGLSMVSKIGRSFTDTITAIAHPLPGIALLPVIILWLGTGSEAILFIIIHSVVWPMTLNLLAGFRSIPVIYREVGRNIGLNPFQNTGLIMIPASLPFLLAGMKIGWARAWRALISAEMIFGAAGGEGGLGWYIFKRRVFMDTPGIYAGIIVIVIIGILVEDVFFHQFERLTVKKWGMSN